ncbi:GNAT family N-acetyltransferase, partial [Kitasatospora sp. NPDC059648]|uniref:GNAT family N-acetyltransferase n=1 Tax=Kitasatospora sp. NPDC059648 TaxID=3346894 RepID=UPI0036C20588
MLTGPAQPGGAIRPATAADLPALARLCAAHADFERAEPVPADLAVRLEPALFSARPRAWCLVVDRGGELIGYASYSREFSTWRAADHVHLDCLFVTEAHRREGWGRALLAAVRDAAVALGAAELQWQTPDWNTDAVRFYHRAGARGRPKVRFSLASGPGPTPAPAAGPGPAGRQPPPTTRAHQDCPAGRTGP